MGADHPRLAPQFFPSMKYLVKSFKSPLAIFLYFLPISIIITKFRIIIPFSINFLFNIIFVGSSIG